MLYTTSLVTVEVPESYRIMLTLSKETSDFVDLTEEAVLIIDHYVRSNEDFIKKIQDTKKNSNTLEKSSECENTENTENTVNSQRENLDNDKVLCAEIILPENAVITINNIELTHQKAGEILSLSVSELLEKHARERVNK